MLTIKVTKEDITYGKYESFTSCPIARAVRRTLKVKPNVEDGNTPIDNGGRYRVAKQWAKVVSNFISKFDNITWLPKVERTRARARLKPFTFKVKKVS